MIPVHLSINGFLSYHHEAEIDFSAFDLACIAGANGAGKSSLLDAITWALFGQARKRDDSIINAQSNVARVELVFAYETNLYRVTRIKPRDKTMQLAFHILQDAALAAEALASQPALARGESSGRAAHSLGAALRQAEWKPLDGHTLRESDTIIQQTLRMDYETFTNASFFLQGKADQFTQQRPSDRKRILSSILGLEIWERYREAAADQRRQIDADIRTLDGQLQEITRELSEEAARRAELKRLQLQRDAIQAQRKAQDDLARQARRLAEAIQRQQKQTQDLARLAQTAQQRRDDAQRRLEARLSEAEDFNAIIARSADILAAYTAWQQAERDLQRLDEEAARFRDAEKEREAPRQEILTQQARLETEHQALLQAQEQAHTDQQSLEALTTQLDELTRQVQLLEEQAAQRPDLETTQAAARERITQAETENRHWKVTMDEWIERIRRLEAMEGAECPWCGQPLGEGERGRLVAQYQMDGTALGDRFRANRSAIEEDKALVKDIQVKLKDLDSLDGELRVQRARLAQIQTQLAQRQADLESWAARRPRLDEVQAALQNETYAPEARTRLAQIDARLKDIGYDTAAHDLARITYTAGRPAQDDYMHLQTAQASMEQLARQIEDLRSQQTEAEKEAADLQRQADEAAAALAAAQVDAPDLNQVEQQLFDLQEQENTVGRQLGAAEQKVNVLEDQKQRLKLLNDQRETLAHSVRRLKQLERAFSKDGVPALLIEQALPEIENRANDILARLSDGGMSVAFVTQAAYKDKNRDDLRETLDIQIRDGVGWRDYEMFSGGEGFRVNFAIRLALSEVLAQRAGARLQTLVIDEGFGSQDAQGRQRLVEAINLVRPDFRKILVITHIEELKDAFSHRIEVEKTGDGSMVRVY